MKLMMFEGDIAIDDTPRPGREIAYHEPFVWVEDEMAMFGISGGASTLNVTELAINPSALFALTQRHDGTRLFTSEGIAAVTEAAENFVKERGETWLASKVRVIHEMQVGDMPYGKAVSHSYEAISIGLAKAQ